MTFWEVIGWAVAALVVAAVATVVIATIIGLLRGAKRSSRKDSPKAKALDVAEAYREARKLDPNMLPEQAYLLGAQWGHRQAQGKSDA